MSLYTQWKELKETANTENTLMTISDIVRFYERGRIEINPAYQRNYRWSNLQKTKFIESILLKYPIPPIIAIKIENDEGLYNYEIIDGVQRLSTIFEFLKIKPKNGNFVKNSNESLKHLQGASKLTELNGKTWEDFKELDFDFVFDSSTLLFTNLTSASKNIQYECFERLNTLSSRLSPQEIRNSLIALKDPKGFDRLYIEINSMSKNIFPEAKLSSSIDLEFFCEFSLIKRFYQYEEILYKEIENSKGENHFDILMTSYIKLVSFDELFSDLEDYKIFLALHKNYDFKKFELEKNVTAGSPIKFFFEISAFLFTQNIEFDIETLYRQYFSILYADIMKKYLNKNNPNSRVRLEEAKKCVERFNNGEDLYK